MRSFPNPKAWMDGEVRALSRAKKRRLSFRKWRSSTVRARLQAGVHEAKRTYQWRLERHFSIKDTEDMRQAIQHATGYKSRSAPIVCEATLPEELMPSLLILISSSKSQLLTPALQTSTAQISFALSRIALKNKSLWESGVLIVFCLDCCFVCL